MVPGSPVRSPGSLRGKAEVITFSNDKLGKYKSLTDQYDRKYSNEKINKE